LLNYTCRCAGQEQVQLNDEARGFRWVRVKNALEMPINEPTRRLLLAVVALNPKRAVGTAKHRKRTKRE